MANVDGEDGFTQLTKLNVTEKLLAEGAPVTKDNVQIINNLQDLQDVAPIVNGRFKLTSNTVYDFSSMSGVVLPNAFDVSAGGVVIKADTALYAMLFYFGTDSLFQGPNLDIRNITIFAPSAEVFSLTKTGSADYFLCNTILIASAAKFGTFDVHDLNIINSGTIDIADGLTLSGSAWNTTRADGLNLQSSSATFVGIDITGAVLSDPKFDSVVMNAPAGAIGIKSTGDANINANEILSYSNGNFIGGITPLSGGITVGDIRVDFSSNGGLEDSIIAGDPYLSSPTVVTVLADNTYYKVNGTWSSTISERVSVSTDGYVTNISEQPIRIDFSGYVTMEKVGGGSDYIEARLVKNDNVSDPSSIAATNGTENAQPTSVPLFGVFTLQPNDNISMYVSNTGSTANINVVNAKFINFRLR